MSESDNSTQIAKLTVNVTNLIKSIDNLSDQFAFDRSEKDLIKEKILILKEREKVGEIKVIKIETKLEKLQEKVAQFEIKISKIITLMLSSGLFGAGAGIGFEKFFNLF